MHMLYEAINYQRTDNLMVIYIEGPADDQVKLARLSNELTELCAEITFDEEIRVIIIAGAGEKPFSIGTNFAVSSSSANLESQIEIFSVTEPIAKLDRPTIAAVNGDAFGQGLELALACDLRICTETARFAMNHITYGDIPWDGGTQRLSRLVGRSKAMEMILTGKAIDAQEAHRIGLVNKVVTPKELLGVVMGTAHEIASKGPIALRYAKEAIHTGMDLTLEQGLRLEADLYFLLHTTRDRKEGIKAFQEKRSPRFEGR